MSTAQSLVNRAATQLYDLSGVDWPDAELLDYLNEGLAALVTLVPGEFAVPQTVTHVPGTKQQLPLGGLALLRVMHAVDSLGKPTRAATRFELTAMDAIHPGWHQDRAGPVRQWGYAPEDRFVYWVYPPSDGSKAVIELALEPTPVGLQDALPVGSRFDGALVDYMLYRAYSKDTEYAGQDGRAALHYQAYRGAVSGKDS